jgi:stringent starvation protein B
MSVPTTPDAQGSSTRPYLVRALHEWCCDNGFTPYVAVHVDERVRVPSEYVKNDEIVLNVGLEATSGLKLGNEFIEFKARFGGIARDIVVPVDHVVAIYARETGQGMAFPLPSPGGAAEAGAAPAGPAPLRLAGTDIAAQQTLAEQTNGGDNEPPPGAGPGPGRPSLRRIK